MSVSLPNSRTASSCPSGDHTARPRPRRRIGHRASLPSQRTSQSVESGFAATGRMLLCTASHCPSGDHDGHQAMASWLSAAVGGGASPTRPSRPRPAPPPGHRFDACHRPSLRHSGEVGSRGSHRPDSAVPPVGACSTRDGGLLLWSRRVAVQAGTPTSGPATVGDRGAARRATGVRSTHPRRPSACGRTTGQGARPTSLATSRSLVGSSPPYPWRGLPPGGQGPARRPNRRRTPLTAAARSPRSPRRRCTRRPPRSSPGGA